MTDRQRIIGAVTEALRDLHYIEAVWLEGADANGGADEYSDIDLWIDFEDAYEDAAIESVETALKGIGPLDYAYAMPHASPFIRQRIYHIQGMSKFLMIDCCWQLHSRNARETIAFDADSLIESAKVLFDKSGVVQFKKPDPREYEDANCARLAQCEYRFSQLCRVEKYILRGQLIESFNYYTRYVLEPLADMLRLIHTPAYADMRFIHLSKQIPPDALKALERFMCANTLPQMHENLAPARKWFLELKRVYEAL